MTRLAPALLACACLLAPAASDAKPAPPRGTPQRAPAQRMNGVALGLFSEDAGFSYRPLLHEIAALGADHVELVVALYLHDVHSTQVHDHPRYTAPDDAVRRAIADARAEKLRVVLVPILRLEEQKSPDEWRGTLSPPGEAGRAALFASYRERLVALARLAAAARVEALSVGSELSSLDGAVDRAAWIEVVQAVRAVYPGRLLYSGNWDHFEDVGIFDLVDGAGLSAYFKLSEGPTDSVEALTGEWRKVRVRLEALSARRMRPVYLTEVGYLSQHGATAFPWNEGAAGMVDLADQERAYRAFVAAWQDAPPSLLGGVFFWNWYGWGGAHSGGYTPRGKPAAAVIRAWFSRLKK